MTTVSLLILLPQPYVPTVSAEQGFSPSPVCAAASSEYLSHLFPHSRLSESVLTFVPADQFQFRLTPGFVSLRGTLNVLSLHTVLRSRPFRPDRPVRQAHLRTRGLPVPSCHPLPLSVTLTDLQSLWPLSLVQCGPFYPRPRWTLSIPLRSADDFLSPQYHAFSALSRCWLLLPSPATRRSSPLFSLPS